MDNGTLEGTESMSFYRVGILGLLIAIPLFFSLSVVAAEKPLRFAPLPMEGEKILHEQFFGLLRYLQQVIDRPIEMVHFDDNGELLQAFRDDAVDLVYLGPLSYALLAETDEDVEPVVCFREADGQARFTCSLVAMGGYPIDLQRDSGLHISLTQPLSTCARLAVPRMLEVSGRRLQDPEIRFSYAGSHTEAALGVVRGEYDLAGVKTAIAERYRHLNLQTLAVSRPFPGFGLYANRRRLQAEVVERLRQALLRLDPGADAEADEWVKTWGGSLRNGVVEPSHCDDKEFLDSFGDLMPLQEASP
jgi:phosphonate transport system substrate-binding protein